MRLLVLTPKILDESLSATSRLNTYSTLADSFPVHVIARLRAPRDWAAESAWTYTFVRAPRIPGISMAWFLLVAPFVVVRTLVAERADVMLVEPGSLPTALLARVLARLGGVRTAVCMDVRTLPIETRGLRASADAALTRLTLRLWGRSCDAVTAITPGAADWVAARTGVDRSTIRTWSTGVDTELYDPRRQAAPTPRGEGPVRFLYHGVVFASRGLDGLIQAVALLRDRGKHGLTVTILGKGPDVSQLSALADSLGLGSMVVFAPAVPQAQVPEAIAAHDVGVVPLPDLECWNTSSPTKLFEYMAMERPVVLTDIQAHRAVVGDDGYVVWAGGGDSESLACALEKACDDLERLLSQAPKARERVLAEFTWEHQASILREVLTGISAAADAG